MIRCRLRRGGVGFVRPVNGYEVTRQDEIVLGAKTMTPRASAHQPNDAFQADEIVRVRQNLINGKELNGIELGIDYKSVLALAKALN